MLGLVTCLRHLSSVSENIPFSEQERAAFAKDYQYGKGSNKPNKEAHKEKNKKVNMPF